MNDFKDFHYRGYSMTELDEMIHVHQMARTDDVLKENARLRGTLYAVLHILNGLVPVRTAFSDIETLCTRALKR